MGILGKAAQRLAAARKAARNNAPGAAADASSAPPPSPNPMTNLVLADIALRGGGQILRRAVEKGLLGKAYTPIKAAELIKGRSMGQTLVGTAIARIATRSVPGALLVGGGLLAKTLYDRKRGKQATDSGRKAVEKQARRGRG